METELWSALPKEQAEAMIKSISEKVPTKRVGQPEDVAESYLYLMRDTNVTGVNIATNSGGPLV